MIHHAAQKRHPGEIVHAIAEKKRWRFLGRGRCNKPLDLFGTMLAIGIENDHVVKLSIQPVTQSCLDRFTFAAVLAVRDHLCTGLARPLCGRIF